MNLELILALFISSFYVNSISDVGHRVGSAKNPKQLEVAPGQYPYVVALVKSNSTIPYCTGSIVAAKWVLTAGHCIFYNFIVKYGSTNLKNARWINVKVKVLHPLYKDVRKNGFINSAINDMALLLVGYTFGNIRPVALPLKGAELYPGDMASVIGWGRLRQGDTYLTKAGSDLLRKIDVQISNNQFCQSSDKNLLCSTASTETSEMGDSGAPVVKNDVIWGVVASGTQNNDSTVRNSDRYLYVPRYLDWITCVIHLLENKSGTCQVQIIP